MCQVAARNGKGGRQVWRIADTCAVTCARAGAPKLALALRGFAQLLVRARGAGGRLGCVGLRIGERGLQLRAAAARARQHRLLDLRAWQRTPRLIRHC
jgi:hypothetical protein